MKKESNGEIYLSDIPYILKLSEKIIYEMLF